MYPEGYFTTKEIARKCLRWERRLEMAMENGRFFDLRRWGIASKTLNAYFQSEQNDVYEGQAYGQYYKDAHFTAGKNEFSRYHTTSCIIFRDCTLRIKDMNNNYYLSLCL